MVPATNLVLQQNYHLLAQDISLGLQEEWGLGETSTHCHAACRMAMRAQLVQDVPGPVTERLHGGQVLGGQTLGILYFNS